MELVWTITGALSLDHSNSVVWSIDGAWYTGAADGEEFALQRSHCRRARAAGATAHGHSPARRQPDQRVE